MLHVVVGEVLAEVGAALRQAHIDALVVKGAATASLLYADPSERPIRDIDLRVRPEDVARVYRLGLARGWALHARWRVYGNVVFVVRGLQVDFEGHLGAPGLCGLPVADVIARASPTKLGLLVPHVVDHALVLVINAFKDKIVYAPRWSLSDLERIVRAPTFDRDAFLRRVEGAKAGTMTWFVADWLARERNDAVWSSIRDALKTHAERRHRYVSWLEDRTRHGPSSLSCRVLARMGADSPRLQVRSVLFAFAYACERRARLLGRP